MCLQQPRLALALHSLKDWAPRSLAIHNWAPCPTSRFGPRAKPNVAKDRTTSCLMKLERRPKPQIFRITSMSATLLKLSAVNPNACKLAAKRSSHRATFCARTPGSSAKSDKVSWLLDSIGPWQDYSTPKNKLLKHIETYWNIETTSACLHVSQSKNI